MNKQLLRILIPVLTSPIALLGILINVSSNYSYTIIPKLFPDGEDLHLGTLIAYLTIPISLILFFITRTKEKKEYISKNKSCWKTMPKGYTEKI